MGRMLKAITNKGGVSITVLDSTDIVSKARELHSTSMTATAAFGRVLTAASLLGSNLKTEKESITLRVMGDGPIGDIIAVSDNLGNVRGVCSNPNADLPLNEKGKFDVSGLVGKGILAVSKDLGLKEPYIGQVDLVSGEIAEDIAFYLLSSEQQPSACALGVRIGKDLSVEAAAGYITRILPDATDYEIDTIENNLKTIIPVSSMVKSDYELTDIVKAVFNSLEFTVLEETNPDYLCTCSKTRMEKALISIGKNELNEIINVDGKAEIVCRFCNSVYSFSKIELEKLLESAVS
ncbi:MAG: Hsp33 family molecular chaperone HslO [Ruminococcaceae bacterium]|nr:Hsp33 family molecular chaperone HslO [Oscillospiraceae bacterium]